MNFTGIWRLDTAASTFSGPAPATLLMKIDHRDGMVEQQSIATDAAGTERRQIFTFRIGEESISTIGETILHIRADWQDEELLIETVMTRQGRDLQFRDYWSLSADGTHLTMVHRDDALAGQSVLLTRDESSASAFAFDTLPTSP